MHNAALRNRLNRSSASPFRWMLTYPVDGADERFVSFSDIGAMDSSDSVKYGKDEKVRCASRVFGLLVVFELPTQTNIIENELDCVIGL